MIHGLDCRLEALGLLKSVYAALDMHGIRPDCGECCDHVTPVVSYTEVEYMRDKLAPQVKQEVLRRSRHWLLAEGKSTRISFEHSPLPAGEVRELRRQRCPYLNQDGSCLIAGAEPLECRLHMMPEAARSAVNPVMQRIATVYPQKTGFLPAQIMALLRLEEFEWYLSQGKVADAKTARGLVGVTS